MTPDPSNKLRLDQLLAKRGLAPSRSRARDMIARGCVLVGGTLAKKAGLLVPADAEIEINDQAQGYVSRAALKLIAGLDVSGFDVSGRLCVDLGASTGGFTQVLLERGAKSVLAVDVGHGQFVDKLRNNSLVTVREGQNARALVADDFLAPPEVIVSDMSFVSITLAAEPSLRLAAPKAVAILLVKPQFEVGRDGIGKGGLVTDLQLVEDMLARIKDWFNGLDNWQCTHLIPSPITGGDGNKEYLLCGRRDA